MIWVSDKRVTLWHPQVILKTQLNSRKNANPQRKNKKLSGHNLTQTDVYRSWDLVCGRNS